MTVELFHNQWLIRSGIIQNYNQQQRSMILPENGDQQERRSRHGCSNPPPHSRQPLGDGAQEAPVSLSRASRIAPLSPAPVHAESISHNFPLGDRIQHSLRRPRTLRNEHAVDHLCRCLARCCAGLQSPVSKMHWRIGSIPQMRPLSVVPPVQPSQ